MQRNVIELEGLSKTYRLNSRPAGYLRTLLPLKSEAETAGFTALRSLDLTIAQGETLGIIGRNGAGKTTLLQLICGILQPTTGKCHVVGRVCAMIALGAGFDPEFTGRENVYVNGSLAGLSRQQMESRFDSIAEFAGIGDFMEQPLKTYSSGMQVRLAFAIQTALEPEILIIDEALSVGDETFQRKCFARLESLRRQGVTLIFVSHNMQAVRTLCQRVLFLDRGELILDGPPKPLITAYQEYCHAHPDKAAAVLQRIRAQSVGIQNMGTPAAGATASHTYDPQLATRSRHEYESEGARIEAFRLLDAQGNEVNLCLQRQWYTFRYQVRFLQDCEGVSFAMLIKTVEGQELGGSSSYRQQIAHIQAGQDYEVSFRFRCMLTPWTYFLNAGVEGLVGQKRAYPHRIVDALAFRVMAEEPTDMTGLVDFEIEPAVMARHANPVT